MVKGADREALGMARGMLDRGSPETAGLWPRASALLARRALEASIHRLWQRCSLELEGCPMGIQLICLRSYLGDPDLAARAGHAWSALSRACHHHSYDLAPTGAELNVWLAVVDELIQSVD